MLLNVLSAQVVSCVLVRYRISRSNSTLIWAFGRLPRYELAGMQVKQAVGHIPRDPLFKQLLTGSFNKGDATFGITQGLLYGDTLIAADLS